MLHSLLQDAKVDVNVADVFGTHFTCFTGTKVQSVTLQASR
jgi:hypothetical protein